MQSTDGRNFIPYLSKQPAGNSTTSRVQEGLTDEHISRLLSQVKDDVVKALNLQLEQMQPMRHLYPEAQGLIESMSNVHELVVSLPNITETVQKTYGLVQSLDQSRLGMWNKI